VQWLPSRLQALIEYGVLDRIEGVAPDDPRTMDAVERARLRIEEWFYPRPREMHANLGEMYVADPRFAATYEKIRPGMEAWMRDATAADAMR